MAALSGASTGRRQRTRRVANNREEPLYSGNAPDAQSRPVAVLFWGADRDNFRDDLADGSVHQ